MYHVELRKFSDKSQFKNETEADLLKRGLRIDSLQAQKSDSKILASEVRKSLKLFPPHQSLRPIFLSLILSLQTVNPRFKRSTLEDSPRASSSHARTNAQKWRPKRKGKHFPPPLVLAKGSQRAEKEAVQQHQNFEKGRRGLTAKSNTRAVSLARARLKALSLSF